MVMGLTPEDEEALQQFGPRVLRARKALGLSQAELGARAGYAEHSQIGRIERGEMLPTLDKALLIAQALQVSLEALMYPLGRCEPWAAVGRWVAAQPPEQQQALGQFLWRLRGIAPVDEASDTP